MLFAVACEELRLVARAGEPPAFAGASARIAVIDADTVERGGVRYRLLGFDAPEIDRAKCLQERQLGIVAAAWLIELIAKRGAVLDTGPGEKLRRDKYGRILARLLLGAEREDWAAIAIRHGHGKPYDGRGPRPDWCGGEASLE